MRAVTYAAKVVEGYPDDWVLTFPDVPEAITGGDTRERAIELASDALAGALEEYLNRGWDLPPASSPGDFEVVVEPALAARFLVQAAMKAEHLTKRGLAQRLGRDERVVHRILSGSNVSLDLVLKVLAQLGVHPALAV
ncbi:MAG TPA: type II toxin-antitoxin system HicB family antitoxin [Caulobacteraceae bacterium]|nr:type II toxin-antitoxin system HicB family antitoxin [Caulobacteraceae bacterium]